MNIKPNIWWIETFSDEEDEAPVPEKVKEADSEKVKETANEGGQAENPIPSSSTTQTG